MTRRSITLTFCLALLVAGAAYGQSDDGVAIRFLDEPIEDLRSYSDNVLATSSATAPRNAIAQRSAGTSDVLLLPYFETDQNDPQGVNTLFALRNETVRPLPVAADPRADGSLRWSGTDVVLGPLAEGAHADRFTLRAETLCVRVLREGDRAVGAVLRDQRTGAEEPAARQLAALPPVGAAEIALRVRFAAERTEMDSAAQAELAALTTQLQRNPEVPVKLLAYWAADGDEAAASAKIMAL